MKDEKNKSSDHAAGSERAQPDVDVVKATITTRGARSSRWRTPLVAAASLCILIVTGVVGVVGGDALSSASSGAINVKSASASAAAATQTTYDLCISQEYADHKDPAGQQTFTGRVGDSIRVMDVGTHAPIMMNVKDFCTQYAALAPPISSPDLQGSATVVNGKVQMTYYQVTRTVTPNGRVEDVPSSTPLTQDQAQQLLATDRQAAGS